MSASAETGKVEPFFFVADEVHSLKKLSAFPTFTYECRKFGAKYIVGTQSKHQYIKNYVQEALALLAAPALKILLRCNESETAQWISDNIGNEERKVPFNSVSVDENNSGKSSVTYGNRIEKRAVASKEQIMQLPKLHGYWCYEGKVVPFVLQTTDWKKKYPAFIKRTDRFPPPPPEEETPNPVEKPEASKPDHSAKPVKDSDIDLDF